MDNKYLILRDKFKLLDDSEKRCDAYLLGQGLCKAFAEKQMGIPWLTHYSRKTIHVVISKKSKTGTDIESDKYRPDLIGIDRKGNCHVFEAKGYSSGYSKKEHKYALDQVSIIDSINGKVPETRVACFFDLSKKFHGHIIDPIGDRNVGVDLHMDNPFLNYYAMFDDETFPNARKIRVNNDEYVVKYICDGWYYGVNIKVKMLLEQRNFDVRTLCEFLPNGIYDSEHLSVGSDGIILFRKGQGYCVCPTLDDIYCVRENT